MRANFQASFEFRDRWRHLADPRLREVQRFVLPATVTFSSDRMTKIDRSIITINCFAGPSDGNISIEDTDVLSSEYIHLDFSPSYQNYQFDEDTGAMVVSGRSPKIGGNYVVTIQPEE